MSPKHFLHEEKSFHELIRIVANKLEIREILVEKDYWLMHCLRGLQDCGLQFELKGGTSLSKGFNLIDRFSEDVDIRIHPPEIMDVKVGKNQDKPTHIESRRKFYQWVTDHISIDGIYSVERDSEFDDKKLRNGGIRLYYKSFFDIDSNIKPFILLEVGFDVVTPNEPVNISSWIYDHAVKIDPSFVDNRALNVACYYPEYTFIEKLSAILNKFRQQQEGGSWPKNFMRHYADIYCLLKVERVSKFIGTPEYFEHKESRFSKAESTDLSKSEAFLLSDPALRVLYSKEYDKIKDFFYRAPPSFEEILSCIGAVLSRL